VTRWIEGFIFSGDAGEEDSSDLGTLLDNLTMEADIAPGTMAPVFRAEYRFSTRFSALGSRDEYGDYGVDLQYRMRFR
jgi:hypothetical protein